ncbi:hypothetical protein BS47DRAFT_1337690, partial [Hydnum rufescens UP504]
VPENKLVKQGPLWDRETDRAIATWRDLPQEAGSRARNLGLRMIMESHAFEYSTQEGDEVPYNYKLSSVRIAVMPRWDWLLNKNCRVHSIVRSDCSKHSDEARSRERLGHTFRRMTERQEGWIIRQWLCGFSPEVTLGPANAKCTFLYCGNDLFHLHLLHIRNLAVKVWGRHHEALGKWIKYLEIYLLGGVGMRIGGMGAHHDWVWK